MLDRIEDAIEDIRNGKPIIVVDDENRENEGDILMAAIGELDRLELVEFWANEFLASGAGMDAEELRKHIKRDPPEKGE